MAILTGEEPNQEGHELTIAQAAAMIVGLQQAIAEVAAIAAGNPEEAPKPRILRPESFEYQFGGRPDGSIFVQIAPQNIPTIELPLDAEIARKLAADFTEVADYHDSIRKRAN